MKAKEDFAGVRGQTAPVEFTVYGLECDLHEDTDSAQYFNLGQHLLQLRAEPSVKVDRYDVRLLLDDVSLSSEAQPGTEAENFTEEELHHERFSALTLAESSDELEAPKAAAGLTSNSLSSFLFAL